MQFDRYTVRLLEEKDVEPFFSLIDINRERLAAFFSGTVARTTTIEDTGVYVKEIMGKIADKIYLPYIVIDTLDNSFVAFVDLKHIDWNIPKAELGCFIDAKFEHKGLAYKALATVVQYYMQEQGFNKLFLRTHESNTSARSLAERCGFIIEGNIRRDYKTSSGELADLLYYGLIREDLINI